MIDIDKLDFGKGGGLVTVVTQDARTGVLLMVAHADRLAMEKTIETGEMHYHSRRRGLWHKGETSGNTQRLVSLTTDCDSDAILARVDQSGPACHEGSMSCFGKGGITPTALSELDAVIESRASGTDGNSPGYTVKLLNDRNLRLKKLGEEAAEFVIACADGDRKAAVEEAADLVYHTLVALRSVGSGLADVEAVLARRAAQAGSRSV